ncbi:MAG: hypothetical protein IJL14_07865 [Selenomonadaceae bacterium]|nr:hypothetical protein [Selenomonadaceae bacterium]
MDEKKPCDLQENLRKMMQTTKKSDLERALQKMMQTTKSNDLKNAFEKMIHVTRSFDQEVEQRQKESEKNIADAFQKMIRLSRSLELENEEQLAREEADKEAETKSNEKKIDKVKNKVPRRIRSFPAAFKRNPKAVIKYFLGMALGRVLAIVLYVLMAFIPALPIPDAVANISKPPAFLGTAFSSMRSFVTDFNPQMIIATITSIPTDINKIIQKVGEFFTFYAKRAGAFIVRAVRHPRLAFEDTRKYIRSKAPMFIRLARAAVSVAFSFLLIKLAMIFLLPLFGGIALTVLGIKVSIILFVIARMIADKVGELIGKYVFKGGVKAFSLAKTIRESQVVKAIGDYLREWLNQATNKK